MVVAAGSGSRLGAEMPKAMVEVAGRTLVWHAVSRLVAAGVQRVAVTVPRGHLDSFASLLRGLPVVLTHGGAERQDSVMCGLAALGEEDDAIVLIHDAARPGVSRQVVERVVQAVADGADAAVPVIAVSDSIRALTDDGSVVVDRSALRAVQTPQGFRYGRLRRAHETVAETGASVTDDATAVELDGGVVRLVEGDHRAMKVTGPFDLDCVRLVLEGEQRR